MTKHLFHLLGWLTLAALLSPLVVALWVSFSPDELLRPPLAEWSLRWYRQFWREPRWQDAVVNSLVVGLGSVLVALATGVPLAVALVRHRFRGGRALSGLVLAPLCVPPLVLGMGLLPLMHALGLWGTWPALMLAHGLVGLPIVYLTTRAALEGVPPELEEAARGLGASPWQTFWRVTGPLVRPGVLAGAALAFVLSLNESVITLFLAAPETETLARVIWPELRYSLSPLVAVASGLTLAATLALAAAAHGARRLERWLLPRRRSDGR
jgi:ABC-type spermidine/putrescine transport system permease subunit II